MKRNSLVGAAVPSIPIRIFFKPFSCNTTFAISRFSMYFKNRLSSLSFITEISSSFKNICLHAVSLAHSFALSLSFVRDSSYHDTCYKGCGLLCAHKKSFSTAIPVRSLGPYMYVHYCTCIVHILVWAYLFRLTSFFDYLSFMWIVFKTSI